MPFRQSTRGNSIKGRIFIPGRFFAASIFTVTLGDGHESSGKVRVRFFNEANVVEKVKREFKSRGLPGPVELEDGSLEYHGEIYGVHNFSKWVLSFGSSAEVLEPEWFRDKMIDIAKRWCELHG